MRRLDMTAATLAICVFGANAAVPATATQGSDAREMTITSRDARPPRPGPAENFTGAVRVEPLFPATAPSRTSGGAVTFDPGARSAWHIHPLGQILIVTSGTGWVQQEGGPKREMRPGDVVWTPPGVKHWHGATLTEGVTHVAIQESLEGKNVEWLEKVTDEQYGGAAGARSPATGAAGRVTQPNVGGRRLSPEDVRRVAPALERYTQERLYGEVWNRPVLSRRDRSLVTVAALIAMGQTGAMPYYFEQALENGVTPRELSEVITHMAFYTGWGNAFGAVGAAKDVFARRGIGADQLPADIVRLLPLDEAAEARRAAGVEEQFGAVAPGLVQYTTDVLFRELWLRPDLAPRDRSLVTVSALITSGQVAQLPYHLERAMDGGLTREQAGEVITHLGFYVGWPKAFSALPVAKDVFAKRRT